MLQKKLSVAAPAVQRELRKEFESVRTKKERIMNESLEAKRNATSS